MTTRRDILQAAAAAALSPMLPVVAVPVMDEAHRAAMIAAVAGQHMALINSGLDLSFYENYLNT